MTENTAGKNIPKAKNYLMTEASRDDPIFNRSYYIGRTYTVKSLKDTREKTSEPEKVKHTPEQLEKLRNSSEKIMEEFIERTKMGSM
jgi:hypothetical protein